VDILLKAAHQGGDFIDFLAAAKHGEHSTQATNPRKLTLRLEFLIFVQTICQCYDCNLYLFDISRQSTFTAIASKVISRSTPTAAQD
jgi:hypothetical protein